MWQAQTSFSQESVTTSQDTDTLSPRYSVGEHIQRGAFGDVFLGKDVVDECPVAIKKFDHMPAFREANDELSERDIMLALTPHPSIVEPLDFAIVPGLCEILVLEYMPGGDLFDRLQDDGVVQMDWRRWLVQAAEGLE